MILYIQIFSCIKTKSKLFYPHFTPMQADNLYFSLKKYFISRMNIITKLR